MKMIYAGLNGSPQLAASNWRYNCTLNIACQRKYYMPLKQLVDLDLYFELPFMPTSYTIVLVDICNDAETAVVSSTYVVGEHPRGFYGVFSNLAASGVVPKEFYFKAIFYKEAQEAYFYSHDFTTGDCFNTTKVEACYNDASIGTEAYDLNGVYYGFPINGAFLGNNLWRYYHTVILRLVTITGTRRKLSLTTFNHSRIYKAIVEKQFNFQAEIVPEFYLEVVLGVVARGNILVAGKPYRVAEEIDLGVHTEESKLWPIDIPLVENINTYFSCKETVCRYLPPVIPDPTCCDPVITSSTVETVEVTPGSGVAFVFRLYSSQSDGKFALVSDACSKIGTTGFSSSVFYITPSALVGGELSTGNTIYQDSNLTIPMPETPGVNCFRVVRNLGTGTENAVDFQSNPGGSAIFKENC